MKRLGFFLFITLLPMLGISLMWLITIGPFNWLTVVQSAPVTVFTVIFMLFSFLVNVTVDKEELQDVYDSI